MKQFVFACVLPVLIFFASFSSAQQTIPKAVIVSKNALKQTVTIRNHATGQRHTYFLNEQTRILSKGTNIDFDDIQPGQAVALDFKRTDLGRELNMLRVPELDEITPIEFTDSDETLYISGVVTGVRSSKRTITIHGPKLTQRLTLHVPADVSIRRDNKPVKLKSIRKGDAIEFQYRDSTQGYLIVSGELKRKVPLKKIKNEPTR